MNAPVSRASFATRWVGMSLQTWPSVEYNFGLEVEIVIPSSCEEIDPLPSPFLFPPSIPLGWLWTGGEKWSEK
jgi:hypothetical protein